MSTAGTVTEATVATECGPTGAPARSSRLGGPRRPPMARTSAPREAPRSGLSAD